MSSIVVCPGCGATVPDVEEMREAHRATVDRWARAAWQAWSPHHAQVRAWADELD